MVREGQPPKKTTSSQKLEKKADGILATLELSDKSKLELKKGDSVFVDNEEFHITKSRTAKSGVFLVTLTNEEAEKSFEVTPKELEARFNVGNVSVPALIDRLEKETDAELDKIAELLKNKKIDQLIIHARENREPNLTLMQDPDTQLAIYMLQNLTKENVFTENAAFSMIPKGGSAENLKDFNETKFQGGPVPMEKETSKKGLKMFLDVGGTWPEIDKDGNIHVDHHGEGQRKPTSSAEMVYKILKKADLLKENPPWLPKYIELLNSIENLTYLNKKENGKRVFDEEYLKQVYPNSLYSLMDDDNVFSNQILELCANGTIKDPTKPFTKEELDGELGKTPIKKKVREKVPGKNQEEETRIVIKEFTIKELCAAEEKEVENTIKGIEFAEEYARRNRINLKTDSLGEIVYHNFPLLKEVIIKSGKRKGEVIRKSNKIQNDLAFKTVKARGKGAYVCWDKENKRFFINSNNFYTSDIVKKLNEKYPGCAKDVRGVMVFGKTTDGLTEEEFLNIVDPKILKNVLGGVIDNKPTVESEKKPEGVYDKTLNTIVNDTLEKAKKRLEEEKKENPEKIKKEQEKKELETKINNLEIKIAEFLKELRLKGVEHLDGFIKYNEKMKTEATIAVKTDTRMKKVLDFLDERITTTKGTQKLVQEQEELKKKLKELDIAPVATVDTSIETTPIDIKKEPEVEKPEPTEEKTNELPETPKNESTIVSEPIQEPKIEDPVQKIEETPPSQINPVETTIEKKEKDITVEGVVFKNPTFYSIPYVNGNFNEDDASSSSENSFHVVDEKGNVGLLDSLMRVVAIENLDYYLLPLWEIQNISDRKNATGLRITKLAKVDSNGKFIEKGKLYFTTNEKVEYDLGEKEPEKKSTNPAESESKEEKKIDENKIESGIIYNEAWMLANSNPEDIRYAQIPDQEGKFDVAMMKPEKGKECFYIINTKTKEAVLLSDLNLLKRLAVDYNTNLKPVLEYADEEERNAGIYANLSKPIKLEKSGNFYKVVPGGRGVPHREKVEPKK